MKNQHLPVSALLLIATFFACKKDPSPVTEYPNFSQLKTGNYWIYERFNIDSAGNASATGILDSCYVEKDTMISNEKYFKLVSPQPYSSSYSSSYLRDSLHYIITSEGQIIFSSQNFTDTFSQYYITAGVDTVCNVFTNMSNKDAAVTTPNGVFSTYTMKTTYAMYPNWAAAGNPRYLDRRYAENIGIVTETLPFYASIPDLVERRLVRYKLN